MAIDVVALDLVIVVGFGQQVACGIVDVFCGDAVSCGLYAVADTVVDVLVVAVLNQTVGVVEIEGCCAFGFQLAFVVVAEVVFVGAVEPVFLAVVVVVQVVVNQLFRQDGSSTMALMRLPPASRVYW